MMSPVESYPAKDFFISMLTRDIDLQDAILDLLDNCVDGAMRSRTKLQEKSDSLNGFWAKINFDGKSFTIEDNCGGIPWTLAEHYAFRMGRAQGTKTEPGAIGAVGIGMKRAIFKMGRDCEVITKHENDAYTVKIPSSWFKNERWDSFEAKPKENKNQKTGTKIIIKELLDATQLSFGNKSFKDDFRQTVAESYAYILEKGFKVTINDDLIKPNPVKLYFEKKNDLNLKGTLIRPYIYNWKEGDVNILLAVGYRSPLKTEKERTDESKASFAASGAGWTVVCNDRVVVSNDKTIKTGWGFGGVPNFHNQFSSIAGVVVFSSEKITNLPITTTKRGVDTSKEIYILVRQKMQEGLKLFTSNTNKWKGFEKEIKDRFTSLDKLGLSEIEVISKKIKMAKISQGAQFKPDLPVRQVISTVSKISFTKENKEIGIVSNYLFDELRSANEVGEVCFDRFFQLAK